MAFCVAYSPQIRFKIPSTMFLLPSAEKRRRKANRAVEGNYSDCPCFMFDRYSFNMFSIIADREMRSSIADYFNALFPQSLNIANRFYIVKIFN